MQYNGNEAKDVEKFLRKLYQDRQMHKEDDINIPLNRLDDVESLKSLKLGQSQEGLQLRQRSFSECDSEEKELKALSDNSVL